MKIEEEIKQGSFQNEYQKLAINLKFTDSWLSGHYEKVFRSYKISSQQFNVLRILKGQFPKPSSLLLIRERMLDKESNASRLIDKLEKSDLINRVQCPKDRRQLEITITEKGMQLLEQINPQVSEMTRIMSNLNEEEAKILNNLLDKLRTN